MRHTFSKHGVALALVLTSLLLGGCDTPDATEGVIDNAFPQVPDGGDTSNELVVYKAWYAVSEFFDPVVPGGESPNPNRLVPVDDYVYLLVAPGWDPGSKTPPTKLLPMKTDQKWSVSRGETLHIRVSDATVTGNCAAGKPLSQEDADFITRNIFPGDFADAHYDAQTCTTALAAEGGDR